MVGHSRSSGPYRSAASEFWSARLQSARAIAALIVAVAHAKGAVLLIDWHLPVLAQPNLRDGVLRFLDVFINSPAAVTSFFVISGFVIGLSLDRLGRLSPAAYFIFLSKRALRLYPAHLVAILGMIGLGLLLLANRAPLNIAGLPPDLSDWYSGVQFSPLKLRSVLANLSGMSWSLNLVAWSLYVQLCVAPLLPIFHWVARADRLRVDLLMLAILIALAALTWPTLWSTNWFVFYLGMLIPTQGRRWADCLIQHLGTRLAIVLAAAVTVVPGAIAFERPLSVFVIEAFGAFMLVSVLVWSRDPAAFRWLESPLLRWSGRISYSFYLWHFIVLTLVIHELYARIGAESVQRWDWLWFLAVTASTVGLALALARLSYVYVEQPVARLGATLMKRPRRPVRGSRLSGAGAPAQAPGD